MLSGTMKPIKRKLFMYSGHDTTVAPILHALGRARILAQRPLYYVNGMWPDFSSFLKNYWRVKL
jgi:hypothetical protein